MWKFLILFKVVLSTPSVSTPSSLPILSDEDFATFSNSPVFALFTSDSCVRCQSIEASLIKSRSDILKNLLESGVDQSIVDKFNFVKLDLHNNTKLKNDFQVEGVPTLLLVKPTHVHEYGGPTNSESLSKWLTKRLTPALHQVKDEVELGDFLNLHEVAIVLESDEETAKQFSVNIEPLREIPAYAWIHTSPSSEPYNRVRIFKRGLPEPLVNKLSDGVGRWLYENQVPIFGEINLSNLHAYIDNMKPFVWFVGPKNMHSKYEQEMNKLILDEKIGQKFWWVWLDPEGGEANSQFIKQSLRPKNVPGWIITDYKGPGRFHLTSKDVNSHIIEKWLTSVLDDTAHRHLLSDPIPVHDIDQSSGLEWVVTDNLVSKLQRKDRPSDLFLVIETLWCEQCALLLQAAVQVAHAIKDSEAQDCVRIARIEAHSNELDPQWDLITTSPALLFPFDENSNSEKVKDQTKIPFDDEPTADGLIRFLQKHGKCRGLKNLKSNNLKVNIIKEEL